MIVLLLILAITCASLPSSEFSPSDWRKIVIISDIHGDDMGFLKSLWMGLRQVNTSETISFDDFLVHMDSFAPSDDEHTVTPPPLYTGNDVLFVQMGDLIDRGINGQASYDLLAVTERALGWTTRFLYGNHDLAAAVGLSYWGMVNPLEDIKDRNIAFGPGGHLKNFLLSNALLAVRLSGSSLFVHGGMNWQWVSERPEFSAIASLNAFAAGAVVFPTRAGLEALLDASSPLMTRPDENSCANIDDLLEKFSVKRIVVGHTIQMDQRVNSLCDGRVVFTDVMISRWMTDFNHDVEDTTNGRPSVVLLDTATDTLSAFYSEGLESESIYELPILPQSPASVLGVRMRADNEEGIIVYSDSKGEIEKNSQGFHLTVYDEEQMYRIEYVLNELVDDETFPLPGLPDIDLNDENSPPKRKKVNGNQYRCLLVPNRAPVEGATVTEKIFTITRLIHEHGLCVGFVPHLDDPEVIKAMDPAVHITGFFHVQEEGSLVHLINLSRLAKCEDPEQFRTELEYMADAFDMELPDGELSSLSESQEGVAVPARFGTLGSASGVITRVENPDNTCLLLKPVLDSAKFGFPAYMKIVDQRSVFVPVSDNEWLENVDFDSNLALQVTGVFEHAHAQGICLLNAQENNRDVLDRIRTLFTVSYDQNAVTLVDFSEIRECEDEELRANELMKIMEAFIPFLSEDETDTTDSSE